MSLRLLSNQDKVLCTKTMQKIDRLSAAGPCFSSQVRGRWYREHIPFHQCEKSVT